MGRQARRGARPEPAEKHPRADGEILYGRNGVLEALKGRRSLRRLMLARGVAEDTRIREIVLEANRLQVPVERIERVELDRMTHRANHQGVGLVVSEYQYAPFESVVRAPGTVLVLDHLQDPQNLGTLFRAADAAGVAGVVLPRDRSASVTAAVVNSSAGAVEHLLVSQQPNLVRALETLKQSGRWIIGLETGEQSIDLFSADLPLPAVLVVGAEGTGLSSLVRKSCDLLVAIPMTGRVASLNASTAGSIALFELVRRTRL